MNRGLGEYGRQTVLSYKLQQDIDLVKLDAHFIDIACRSCYTVKSVARLQSLGRECQVISLQIGECDTFSFGQRMIFTHDNRQAVLKQNMRLYVRITYRRPERKHKIHLAPAQHIHKLGNRLVINIELYTRIRFHKRHQRFGQNRTERISHPDVECSDKQGIEISDLLHTQSGVVESRPRERQQFRSGLGESHLMARALEKRCAKFLLELLDLL